MNIYDFDNTILKGDSSVKFIIYSLHHHPLLVIKGMFKAFLALFKSNKKKGIIKSNLYSFVKDIPNLDNYVHNFILKNNHNIKKFYLDGQKDDDVVMSATYDFIIEPFCASLGIKNVIATKYDTKKGMLIGNHCKGEEKIKRFDQEYPNAIVENAYSDSFSDMPMFKKAKKAYLVKNDKLELLKDIK